MASASEGPGPDISRSNRCNSSREENGGIGALILILLVWLVKRCLWVRTEKRLLAQKHNS